MGIDSTTWTRGQGGWTRGYALSPDFERRTLRAELPRSRRLRRVAGPVRDSFCQNPRRVHREIHRIRDALPPPEPGLRGRAVRTPLGPSAGKEITTCFRSPRPTSLRRKGMIPPARLQPSDDAFGNNRRRSGCHFCFASAHTFASAARKLDADGAGASCLCPSVMGLHQPGDLYYTLHQKPQ